MTAVRSGYIHQYTWHNMFLLKLCSLTLYMWKPNFREMLGGAGSLITESICRCYQLWVESFYGSSLTCFGITWNAQIQLCLATASSWAQHSSNTDKVKWELQCSQQIVSHQNCQQSDIRLACHLICNWPALNVPYSIDKGPKCAKTWLAWAFRLHSRLEPTASARAINN